MLLSFTLACAAPDSAPDAGAGVPAAEDDPSAAPLAGLSEDWQARYDAGNARFGALFRFDEGIGPTYIRPSCTACHADASRGPGTQTRMVVTEADGITPAADQSALPYGDLVRPYVSAGATHGVTVPDGVANLLVTERIGPAVFGRGYVDAVDDTEVERVEAEEAAAGLVSGRINRVSWDAAVAADDRFSTAAPGDAGLVGRFGMKASFPTLDRFVAGALQGDIGITSALLPDELPNPDGVDDDWATGVDLDSDGVDELADYVRLLALPRRESPDDGGAELFAEVGCADCHVPTLHTRADYPIPQLADVDAPIYSDLLLHDRGAALADGIIQGDATGREWRTAPLIGLRFLGSYMHDGRATTLTQAIDSHAGSDSESDYTVSRFHALSATDQDTLLAWLATL